MARNGKYYRITVILELKEDLPEIEVLMTLDKAVETAFEGKLQGHGVSY